MRLLNRSIVIVILLLLAERSVDTAMFHNPLQAILHFKAAIDLQQISEAIEAEHILNNDWPKDIGAFINENFTSRLSHKLNLDPWGNPYGFSLTEDYFTVYSLGPDGIKHTPDDVFISRLRDPLHPPITVPRRKAGVRA